MTSGSEVGAPADFEIHVAKRIRAQLDGDDSIAPFKYFDKGSMATIGHNAAVAQSFGMKFTGPLGYLMWGFIHVKYLIGWGNRFVTLYSWMRSLSFSHHRAERVITFEQAHHALPPATPDPAPGDVDPQLRKRARG